MNKIYDTKEIIKSRPRNFKPRPVSYRGVTYKSVSDCARKLNKHVGVISRCLNRDNQTYMGYPISYKD